MKPKGLPVALLVLASAAHAKAPSTATVLSVCFTPGPQCSLDLAARIRKARKVRGQYYGFSDADVAKAYLDAAKAGADIEVILDRSNVRQRYSAITFLTHLNTTQEMSSRLLAAINQGLDSAAALALSDGWHGRIYGYAVLEGHSAQVYTTRFEPKWPIVNLIGHVKAIDM